MGLYQKEIKAFLTATSCDKRWLRALRFGVAPSLESLPALRLMQASTIIDIGANRGQFALAVRRCFPQAVIHSFESLPEPAAALRRVFAGDNLLRLYKAAIDDEPGNGLIQISAKDDSSSFLKIDLEQDRIYPGTSEVRTKSVSVVQLAYANSTSDLSEISLLKLYVQGCELHVLKGCTEIFTYFFMDILRVLIY